MLTLVIVESPAKARKIAGYLGPGYVVHASLGHVRDLPGSRAEIPGRYAGEPWAGLGVHPGTFRPIYVVPQNKRRTVEGLRALARKADRVLFAADPDREGEAIAWHLSVLLEVRDPVRLVYTEITREALQAALARTRPLNLPLVAAQESRRVIDRLVGYGVSPLLWSSVGGKLSAGRVQSAALMLLAQREMARMKFTPATFWTLRADVLTRPRFVATVTHVRTEDHPGGHALARAGDFTEGGVLRGDGDVLRMTDEQVEALCGRLDGQRATVTAVERSETRSRPAPPFTTSTLQQAGARLKLGARQVMDLAQRLYEAGHITYMRTDSPALSDEALTEARRVATTLFGEGAVPGEPRQYATRNGNAQEAHEAIRPAGVNWKAPAETDLTGDGLAVYALVYQRTVASQMHDAVHDRTVVTLDCGDVILRAQGRVLRQAGHTGLLTSDDEDAESQRLPEVTVGQAVPLKGRPPEGRRTSAPARYTEATLVHAMERVGIGRPSTYAQTLATLAARDYTRPLGRALAVTATGLLVATYLARQVPEVAQADFTARMEAGLDDVAAGHTTRVAYLRQFWTEGLAPRIRAAGDDPPTLPLPHLPGARLRATASGVKLYRGGQSVPLPPEALPAELDEAAAAAVLAGTWRPKKGRPARGTEAKVPAGSPAGSGAEGRAGRATAVNPGRARQAGPRRGSTPRFRPSAVGAQERRPAGTSDQRFRRPLLSGPARPDCGVRAARGPHLQRERLVSLTSAACGRVSRAPPGDRSVWGIRPPASGDPGHAFGPCGGPSWLRRVSPVHGAISRRRKRPGGRSMPAGRGGQRVNRRGSGGRGLRRPGLFPLLQGGDRDGPPVLRRTGLQPGQ